MDLGSRIGWGIVIYAVVFLASAGMTLYGWTSGVAPYLVELLVLAAVCVWAGSELKFRSWKDILPYSIGWAIIAVALDALYAVPLQGWDWFGQWTTWASYLLVALLPLLASFLKRNLTPHGVWES